MAINDIPTVSFEDYEDATENYLGWCPVCQEFTTSECEPDAHDRECEQCNEHRVVGAEDALMMGLFDVDEENEDGDQ